MEMIHHWELEIIRFIQLIKGDVVTTLFKGITFLGEETFILIFLPLLLWAFDYKTGLKVMFLFLISLYINYILKNIFMLPRPFQLDSSVMLIFKESYGMPSGHSVSAVAIWGFLAYCINKSWAWITAFLLIFLVGFSRIYLGVHFLSDVLAGWLQGIVFLIILTKFSPHLEKIIKDQHLAIKLSGTILIPLLMVILAPEKTPRDMASALLGLSTGAVLLPYCFTYTPGKMAWKRILRFLTGGVGMLAIYIGLKALFPGEESSFFIHFRFVRYMLLGFWLTPGAPLVFKAVGLNQNGLREAKD